MAVAVYFRVSSTEQRMDAQRTEVERWLRGHGHNLAFVRVFEDKDSGATLDRPGFEALQAAIFAGEVETLIVWRLDRLSRSLRDGVNVLTDLQERGIRVVSVAQQLDLSGPIGRLVSAVLLGIAEIERAAIRERQRAGIEAAKARGVYTGRRRGSTKAQPSRARELAANGLKRGEIARAMGVSVRTVARYLVPTNGDRPAVREVET